MRQPLYEVGKTYLYASTRLKIFISRVIQVPGDQFFYEYFTKGETDTTWARGAESPASEGRLQTWKLATCLNPEDLDGMTKEELKNELKKRL